MRRKTWRGPKRVEFYDGFDINHHVVVRLSEDNKFYTVTKDTANQCVGEIIEFEDLGAWAGDRDLMVGKVIE